MPDDAREVIGSGRVVEREVSTLDRSRQYLMRVLPYRAPHKPPEGVVVTFVDLTERTRMAAELREQAQVLDLAQILVRGMDGRIVWWNSGATALYGYTSGEAVGAAEFDAHLRAFVLARQAERL